jgi:hypothetical protein
MAAPARPDPPPKTRKKKRHFSASLFSLSLFRVRLPRTDKRQFLASLFGSSSLFLFQLALRASFAFVLVGTMPRRLIGGGRDKSWALDKLARANRVWFVCASHASPAFFSSSGLYCALVVGLGFRPYNLATASHYRLSTAAAPSECRLRHDQPLMRWTCRCIGHRH